MAASREVRVAIVGDPSSLQRALRTSETGLNSFQSHMTSIGSHMQSAGRTLTRGLTLPLLVFGTVGVRELMSAEDALAQTEAAITSTGGAANRTADQIVALSQRLSDLSGVDDEVVQGMENVLLTFQNISGDTFDDTALAVLNLSEAMDTDLNSAALQVGKAMNNPIRGLTALRRAGVEFTDAQMTAIESMVAFGDLAGAQQIILGELTEEFGGSAEAAGETFGGQLQKAKNDVEDLAGQLVESLMPVFEDLVGVVQNVADWFDSLSDTQKRWIAVLVGVAAAAGPVLGIVGSLITVIAGLTLVTGGVILVLGLLAVALIYTWQNWDKIKAKAQEAIGWIIANVPGSLPVMFALVSIVVGLWQALQKSVTVGQALVTTLASIGQQGLGVVLKAYQMLAGAISAAAGAAKTLLDYILRISAAIPGIPSISIPGLGSLSSLSGLIGSANPDSFSASSAGAPGAAAGDVMPITEAGMRRVMERTISPVVVLDRMPG